MLTLLAYLLSAVRRDDFTCYLAENAKSIKTLGVGGLHRFPDPVADPCASMPHLHSQHFGLPVLDLGGRPRELRAPRLLLNQSLSKPCYAWIIL